MVLTEKQKVDLHRSILEYLMADGGSEMFPKTIQAFMEEANITDTSDFGKNLLEKKWTSVVRLQKRVMDLEAQISDMQKRGHGLNFASGHDGSPNGHVTLGENRLLPKGPAKATLSGHRGSVLCVDSHPLYSLIATGSDDATVKIWDYETAQYERTLKGHTGSVTGVAFNAGTTNASVLLATCSSDMTAKLWDLTTFSCIKTFRDHDHTLSAIRFMPSGDHIITCSRDKTVKCWETSTGYCIKTLVGHNDWVKCIAVSLDGQYIASGGSDQTIILWKFPGGTSEQTLRGHGHVIECLSFGRKPITASDILSPSKQSSSLSTPLKESSSEEKLSAGDVSSTISVRLLTLTNDIGMFYFVIHVRIDGTVLLGFRVAR
jgi:platelet-activating factor acetylhydrolase IB subunit alpha